MLQTANIELGGQHLLAAADRTLYDPARRSLYVADLHAGKTTHMQRAGLAVPAGNLMADLERLSAALKRTGAERLLFLGDLFHSEVNAEWDVFADWCRAQTCQLILVRGNHDRFLSDELIRSATIEPVTESYADGPFLLRHYPLPPGASNTALIIAGHVHPVRVVYGIGHDRLRMCCFWQNGQQLILPAFGSFTGGYDISRQPASRIICCSPDFQSLVDMSR